MTMLIVYFIFGILHGSLVHSLIMGEAYVNKQRITANKNEPVTLTCSADGPLPILGCGWINPNKDIAYNFGYGNRLAYRKGDYIYAPDGDGLEEGHCSVWIANVREEDYGNWTCELNTAIEYLENYIIIESAVKPSAPEFSSTMPVNNDDSETVQSQITCFSLNGRPPPTFQWIFDNETLNKGLMPVETNVNNKVSNTSQQLNYKFSWKDNGKTLRCLIKHRELTEEDAKEASMIINATFSPRTIDGEVNKFIRVQAQVGMEALLSVELMANPDPTRVVWTVNGENVEIGNEFYQAQMLIKNTSYQAALKIHSVAKQDFMKSFVLTVVNDIGDAEFYFKLKSDSVLDMDSCDEDFFKCKSGKCVHLSKKCNEINECGDYSDEIGCKGKEKAAPVDTPVQLQVISVIAVVVAIAISIGGFCWVRMRRKKRYIDRDELNNFITGNSTAADKDGAYRVPYDKSRYEIPVGSFSIDKEGVLGSGEFGWVCKGYIKVVSEDTTVAIKMMNPQKIRKTAISGLLSEIKVLAYVGKHDNITELLGANTSELKIGKVFIFLELCPHGSLEKYLRKLRPVESSVQVELQNGDDNASVSEVQIEMKMLGANPLDSELLNDLHRWSVEICDAMAFLATKHVVHADLATRNVLLGANKQAKICDFGLSRRMYNYASYVKEQQEPLPWKWMAPESLRVQEFNEKSDVWSYGVTLWEIYSLGDSPYQGLSWDVNFSQMLTRGFRLGEPEFNDRDMYSVMKHCWELNPLVRPSFQELKTINYNHKIVAHSNLN